MPKPMHRSRSFRKTAKYTPKGRRVVHYTRKGVSMPHCAMCGTELNGISKSLSGGRSRRSTKRAFGGVLCSKCTAGIIKIGSRVESGEMKLDDISIRERIYVLQLFAH